MTTQCTSQPLEFARLGRRRIVAGFDGGRMTSDGGALLLREADRLFKVTERVADAFVDPRAPGRIEHDVPALVAQRRFALALGYEDLNDHDRLRDDPALALACGVDDVEGERRVRERDRGHALAASSTLNRLELSPPDEASPHRYKKVVADHEALDRLLVDRFLESHAEPPGGRSSWISMPPTTRSMATKRANPSTASTVTTASCHSSSSAASTPCAVGCGRPPAARRRAH